MRALVAAALLIRWAMLRSRFPYIDDLLQLYAVTRPTLGEAARAMSGIGPLQPPLDYLADFAAARFTGDLSALRLLPLAWGVASVAAAHRLGTRLGGKALGLWWAALLAVSMPLVSFSLTLRTYSLSVLLCLLAWSALEELLDGGKAWPYALAQSLFQVAYPHAWLVGASHLAYVAASRRPSLPRMIRASIIPWAALAGWLGWWHLKVSSAGGFHYEVPWSALTGIARAFNGGQGAGLFLYPALCVAAAGLGPGRFVRSAAAPLLATLAAVFAIHRAESVLLLPRHALPLLPYYLGIAAAGCAALQTLAAERSQRAGQALGAALAAVMACAAAGPLLALAHGESDLSGYLRGFAQELGRRAGPSDVLIFSDPNTGATVLHLLDRGAFNALSGIEMRQGFALFRFPASLAVALGPVRLDAYTLCFIDPGMATVDAAKLRTLRAARKGRIWLITLEGFNSMPQDRPFAALDVRDEDLLPAAQGLFELRR